MLLVVKEVDVSVCLQRFRGPPENIRRAFTFLCGDDQCRCYNMLVHKNFDKWNTEKKRIDREARTVYVHPREIWWCALGVNIGAETDGKNENFERPVLVANVYNKETFLTLPITSIEKRDKFHCPVKVKIGMVWIKLTQARVVSSHRVIRKVDVLSEGEFRKVKRTLSAFI